MNDETNILAEPVIPQNDNEMIIEPEEHNGKQILPDTPKNTKTLLNENKKEK